MSAGNTPECPNCGAKFSHDKALARCKKCQLPDEVKDAGPEAILAWREQTFANRKLFGALHARQNRATLKEKERHPAKSKGGKAPVGEYRRLARLKRASG